MDRNESNDAEGRKWDVRQILLMDSKKSNMGKWEMGKIQGTFKNKVKGKVSNGKMVNSLPTIAKFGRRWRTK